MRRKALLVAATASLWACPDRPVHTTHAIPVVADHTLVPLSSARGLDLLFVIDNSHSMQSEQEKLQQQLDVLMRALADLPGGFPNSHIGVVSSDLGTGRFGACAPGDGGRLLAQPSGSCLAPGGDPFIEISNADGVLSGNIANVDSYVEGQGCAGELLPGDTRLDICDVQAAFRCIAALGTGGCGFEQPLEAARLALLCDDTACANPGFLRDDAALLIAFLGDEDDCSAADDALFDAGRDDLGPLTSYRCFEFGVTCDEPIDRGGDQVLQGCRPDERSRHLHPVQRYHDFFSTLRPWGQVFLASITGPFRPGDAVRTRRDAQGNPDVAPSCTSPDASDSAAPAIRIHDLVRRFGADGVILGDLSAEGICGADFGPALIRLGQSVDRLPCCCLENPLVHDMGGALVPIDDPAQAECEVTEVTQLETGEQARTVRERCIFEQPFSECADFASPGILAAESPSPCWYVCDSGEEARGCAYRWQLRFCRDRECLFDTPPPEHTSAYAQCLACNPAVPGCGVAPRR